MMHKNRHWNVLDTADPKFADFATRNYCKVPEASTDLMLASVLTQGPLVSCAGFKHGDYYYLNEQTSADGAGEWGIVRVSDLKQIESITFGWMKTAEAALKHIEKVNNGDYTDVYDTITAEQIETKEQHGICGYCA